VTRKLSFVRFRAPCTTGAFILLGEGGKR
jgi:hypothetical protein